MLKVKNISSGYNNKPVIFNVSFEIGDNEVVLLTGGNGSGKSTLLKCIYGLLPKMDLNDSSVYFNDSNITWLLTSDMVKLGLVYIPQTSNYFEPLTIRENLIISGSTGTYSTKEVKQRSDEIYQLLNLKDLQNQTPFNLSGGERQLLALGNALMHKPKLILFDEPFAGLDEVNSEKIKNELRSLKRKGIGLLIVEHRKSVFDLVDRELTMDLGRII
jgi:branched-chain amino acid transport system ATP-binding protein